MACFDDELSNMLDSLAEFGFDESKSDISETSETSGMSEMSRVSALSSIISIQADLCDECGGQMVQIDTGYRCQQCGSCKDITITVIDQSRGCRLHMSGVGAKFYQGKLDQANVVTDSTQTKIKRIVDDIVNKNKIWTANNPSNKAFPKNVIVSAVELYCATQSKRTNRNKNKTMILAACVKYACHKAGFDRSDAEIAKMFMLDSRGFAKGSAFLRKSIIDNKLDADINIDQMMPTIQTAIARLSISTCPGIVEFIQDIVVTAVTQYIGVDSLLRSKVYASAFVYIVRYADPNQKPKPILGMCIMCNIRKNTVMKFITELHEYYSRFKDIYRKYGLSDVDYNPKKM